jgi:hypothetical protein
VEAVIWSGKAIPAAVGLTGQGTRGGARRCGVAREERASRGVEWGPKEPERISGTPNGGASAKPRRGTGDGGGEESGDAGGRRKGFGDLFVQIEKFRGLSEN